MARYAISREGVRALRTLSLHLQEHADDVLDAGFRLEQQIDSLREDLGSYEQEISNVIWKSRKAVSENHEAIMALARKLNLKADDIENLISSGLGTGTTAGTVYAPAPAPTVKLVPDRAEPRDLAVTRHRSVPNNEGLYIYDSPLEMDAYLYRSQGAADSQFLGTCGLCACVNVLRLAGVLISELEVLSYARSSLSGGADKPLLCSGSYADPGMNGSTSPMDRQAILRHFGIDSELVEIRYGPEDKVSDSNLDLIGSFVENGKGVILSVHATVLNYDADRGVDDLHAVTVTSTVRDKDWRLLGFYIADSDQFGTRYYPAEKIKKSLSGKPMNVTRQVIR